MNRSTKWFFYHYHSLRINLGLDAYYHSTELCHDHLVPRYHRLRFDDQTYTHGIEMCQKGDKSYWTGERISS